MTRMSLFLPSHPKSPRRSNNHLSLKWKGTACRPSELIRWFQTWSKTTPKSARVTKRRRGNKWATLSDCTQEPRSQKISACRRIRRRGNNAGVKAWPSGGLKLRPRNLLCSDKRACVTNMAHKVDSIRAPSRGWRATRRSETNSTGLAMRNS